MSEVSLYEYKTSLYKTVQRGSTAPSSALFLMSEVSLYEYKTSLYETVQRGSTAPSLPAGIPRS